jgi:hypothetical protein
MSIACNIITNEYQGHRLTYLHLNTSVLHYSDIPLLRCEVFTAVTMNIRVAGFWDVTQYSLVKRYQHSEDRGCTLLLYVGSVPIYF